MKLSARDIAGFLQQPARVHGVLIYGADRGMVKQYANSIAASILADPQDPFNRADLTDETLSETPTVLSDELAAMSFTGERRLIVLRDAAAKHATLIEECLPQLGTHNYLLVYADPLTAKDKLRLLFERHDRLAALPCYQDEGQSLAQLIESDLQKHGFSCDRQVIRYLSEHLKGDRQVIMSELERIRLYFGDPEALTIEKLRHLVESSHETSLDELMDAFFMGDVTRFTLFYDRYTVSGGQMIVILRSCYRYAERLMQAQSNLSAGMGQDQALKSLYPPVFYKQKPVFQRALSLWSRPSLMGLQSRLLQAEIQMKSGRITCETELSQWMIRLCAQRAAKKAA